ncbi:UNVERIFIED_CONTAM: spore germination protein KC [Acetivibrio alkalicellulosi]
MKWLAIIVTLFVLFLSGCWSSDEIDTLAINMVVGIDKSENGFIISHQVINPRAIAVGENASESPVVLFEEEGVDIDETISKFVSKSARKTFNLHLRMVIIGEEVAKDGIKDIIDYFLRNNEYRTDFYIAIARNTTAKEILKILTPIEAIPGVDLYNSLELSSQRLASTKPMRIIELANTIISEGNNPVISGITMDYKGDIIPDSLEELQKSKNIIKLVYSGMGILKEDKLIGWLSDTEARGVNYITGNVVRSVGHSYYKDDIKITYEVIKSDSKITARLIDDKPVIKVKINVLANVTNVTGELDVSDMNNTKILSEVLENRLRQICEDTLSKVQREFKTDIFGFGDTIYRKHPKLWRELKSDWASEFSKLDVNIDIIVKINQLGEITKPIFMKGD